MANADARLPESRPTAADVGLWHSGPVLRGDAAVPRNTMPFSTTAEDRSLDYPFFLTQVAQAIARLASDALQCNVHTSPTAQDLACIEQGRQAMHTSSSERCSAKRYC